MVAQEKVSRKEINNKVALAHQTWGYASIHNDGRSEYGDSGVLDSHRRTLIEYTDS